MAMEKLNYHIGKKTHLKDEEVVEEENKEKEKKPIEKTEE